MGNPPLLGLLDAGVRTLFPPMNDVMAAAGFGHSLTASRLMSLVPADGIRLTELAELLGVTKQSAGELVGQLEKEEYLVRRPDPSDGRAKLIRFGPRGRRSVAVAHRGLTAADDHATAVLGVEDAEHLRRLLRRLVEGSG